MAEPGGPPGITKAVCGGSKGRPAPMLPGEPPWTLGVRSWRGRSLLVVGEHMGDEGNTPLGCPVLYASVSGVKGGDGDRFPGRSMDGRNLRSRSRSGGVSGGGNPLLVAELAGEISSVGEPDGLTFCAGLRCDRRVRWVGILRLFFLYRHSMAKTARATRAIAEHTPMTTLADPDRPLLDVVDPPTRTES